MWWVSGFMLAAACERQNPLVFWTLGSASWVSAVPMLTWVASLLIKEIFFHSGERRGAAVKRPWMRRAKSPFCSGPHAKAKRPCINQKKGRQPLSNPGWIPCKSSRLLGSGNFFGKKRATSWDLLIPLSGGGRKSPERSQNVQARGPLGGQGEYYRRSP